MPRLNIFIDGTWLFNQCAPRRSLSCATETPDQRFPLDFGKLNQVILSHVNNSGGRCDRLGDCYFVISIFQLPANFDEWPNLYTDLTSHQIDKARKSVNAREYILQDAIRAGYRTDAVFRPQVKDYIIRALTLKTYQEKQVDTSVVALLVRSAITTPEDYHAFITGDADILPAIRLSYPQYTKNVVIVTTHPDELNAARRQTSFSLLDFSFDIQPFFLQDHAEKIISGQFPYRCAECSKVFVLTNELPQKARPYCTTHRRRS
jgi:hypothetical protein